jgi:hypothetical protein
MTEPKDGGPAFPIQKNYGPHGMSLRDWFAGQALVGWLSGAGDKEVDRGTVRICSEQCYEIADAMLKVREGNNGRQ